MQQDFASFIESQRTELTNRRQQLQQEKTKLDEQIAEIDRELKAITAYEEAKLGKPVRQATTGGTRRTGVRQEVLDTIKAHPDGISRAEVLIALDAKGDKKAEQSISNALANLKKTGTVTAEDGVYKAAG